MAAPPAAAIISAVSSIVSGRPYGERLPRTLLPVQYTVAPASPSARAMPRPAPRVAPATTAIRPASGVFARLKPRAPSVCDRPICLSRRRRRREASIDERGEADAGQRQPFVNDRNAPAIVRLVDRTLRRHERGLRQRVRFHRPAGRSADRARVELLRANQIVEDGEIPRIVERPMRDEPAVPHAVEVARVRM